MKARLAFVTFMTNNMYALSYAKHGKYVDHRLAIHTYDNTINGRSMMLLPEFSRSFVAIVALNLLEKFWKYSTVSR